MLGARSQKGFRGKHTASPTMGNSLPTFRGQMGTLRRESGADTSLIHCRRLKLYLDTNRYLLILFTQWGGKSPHRADARRETPNPRLDGFTEFSAFLDDQHDMFHNFN